MKPRLVFVALLALAIVQLAVPLSMIAKRESTLEHGTLFRFRTAPVDPYDAFRGRYVALEFEHDTLPFGYTEAYSRGQTVYVSLKEDEDGFARPAAVSRKRPAAGDYVKCRVRWHQRVRYPFDRYYLTEEKAPAAEQAYREARAADRRDAYVAVRIRDGFAVLEELYISDQPILEYLAENPG